MKKKRKYTGTSDGASAGKRAGLEEFVRQVTELSNGVLWNNGTWVVRPKSGKKTLSVHATGRAVDLSWRKVGSKGRVNGRERAEATIQLLVDNANYLGIECVLDYFPGLMVAGWRCDRQAWQNYRTKTIGGAPGSDWYHVEIAPRFADKPAEYIKRFERLKGTPQV
jgi:hypothetical protein